MKQAFILIVLTALSACSFTPPKPEKAKAKEKPIHMCVSVADDTCATYEMRSCHELFVDGCLSGHTKSHECVARHGPPCTTDVEWDCPEGFQDGCDLEDEKKTKSHMCVATRGGVPCTEDISLECPLGFVDLCATVKK